MQAAQLRKEIEKINNNLSDGTALSQQECSAKIARRAVLIGQLTALVNQLPPVLVVKIKHHQH